MIVETLTIILPWLGQWATETIASSILNNTTSQLNKKDIDKALKSSIRAAEETTNKQLFFSYEERFVRNFLDKYFQGQVLEQLKNPLIDKSIDLNFLVFAFQKIIESGPDKYNEINQDFIRPWLEAFKEEYLQKIEVYIKYQYAKDDYFKQLANWYDDVKFVGINVRGQEIDKSEKLIKIFVMQDVKEEKKDSYSSLIEADLLELGDSRNRQEELLRQQQKWTELDIYGGNAFPANDLLTKNQAKKVVLLGAPGSGKTTLMSYLSVVLTDNKPKSLGLDPNIDWLPILIRMRDYVRYDNLGILEYYRQFCHKSLSVKPLPEGFFENWLEDGRVLILLDGLDEIVDEGKRSEIVKKIENFLGSYDQNRVIITSRPAGYRRDFFQAATFPHYWLQPFDDQKIDEFIENWYNSRTPDPEDAKLRKEDIRKAFDNNPRIQLLARNPLLLTIIALIHRYQAQLPKERYKLYDIAVQTLLTTWDTTNKQLENNAKLEYLKNDDWEDVMRNLAHWIHGYQEGIKGNELEGTLIDKNELINFLTDYIEIKKKIEYDYAEKEAERFINFIRDRSGLLNEQGTDCYAFVHKTFQEYLCAQKIRQDMKRNRYNFDIILNAITSHLHDAHWREVLLLLVAQEEEASAAEAIGVILNKNSEYEQWLHRDLLFAGSCLAENPKGLNTADASLVKEILERLVSLEISDKRTDKLREQLFKLFCSLYETDFAPQCLALLKAEASKIDADRLLKYRAELGEKETVIDELIQQLSDTDDWVRLFAAEALGNLGNSSERVIEALLRALSDTDDWVRWNAAEALGKLGNSSERVIEALLGALSDTDDRVRWNAAVALGKLGNSSERVIEALLGALSDTDDRVRRNAAVALGKLGNSSERVIEALLGALSATDDGVRRNAAVALGKLGNSSERVIEALLGALSATDDGVRWNAAVALGKLGNSSERAIEALLGALSATDDRVRWNAAVALGKLGNSSERVIEALLRALSDTSDLVRRNAAVALGNLGNSSEPVIEALLGALSDTSDGVRRNAAVALGNLGKKSHKVLPLVVQWIKQHEDSKFVGSGIDVLWGLVSQ
jgi:HEAT repeat protein/energy-coupling factor transporter ATP-binding protein EcfA2